MHYAVHMALMEYICDMELTCEFCLKLAQISSLAYISIDNGLLGWGIETSIYIDG